MNKSRQAIAYEMRESGSSYREIASELGISEGAVRSSVTKESKKRKQKPTVRTTAAIYANESYSFEGTVDGFQTAEDILRMKKLDPKLWIVKSFVTNTWEQQRKDGTIQELCQYKLTAAPARTLNLTINDIDRYFEEALKSMSHMDIDNVAELDYDPSDEVLEIDIADLHCGLLSWASETGSDWDLDRCADRFLSGIRDIVNRCSNRRFSRVYFCTLGDILHSDTFTGTTTNGTRQDMDNRITKAINVAFETMQIAIEILSELQAPIYYIYTAGNHDRLTGYCLSKMLEVANCNRPIIFDISPNPQKCIHFGKVLVGLTHGDMPSYNKGTWIIDDYRREFGESRFVEEHCGHVHHEEAKMYNGIMVRSVLAQCGNSYWEHQQGYRSTRGIQCFVWHPDMGLRETMYYNY